MRNIKLFLCSILLVLACGSMAHSANGVTFKLVGSKSASAGILSTDVQIGFEVLFNDLLQKTGEKVEIAIYENFDKVEKLFVKDEDFGGFYCSSVEFLQSNLIDYVEKDTLITATYNEHTARKVLLVVKKDSNIRTISNLHNKNITYGQSNDLVELYLNTIAIKSKDVLAVDYFKTINNKFNGSESLVSLYFGNTDIAAVYDDEYELAIELNPQLKEELLIIEESDHLINAVVGIRGEGIDQDTRKLFRTVALEMHNSKKGKKMLAMYGAGKFEAIKNQDLMPVKKLLDVYHGHLEKQ